MLMDYLGIPGDYAALRAMNQDKVLAEYGKAATHLARTYTGDCMLDTHLYNLTNGKLIPRYGDWIADYDILVLVKARPEVILERVEDDTKDRALFPAGATNADKLRLLDDLQEQTEARFYKLAEQYHLPTLVLDNSDNLSKTVDAFIAANAQL